VTVIIIIMPLRTRLSKTGLKLKIPVRNGSASASPYGPRRQSASPLGPQGESSFHKSIKTNDFSPSGQRSFMLGDQKLSTTVKSTETNPAANTVTSFDAAVDSRPVWAVKEEKLRHSTEGFREIPIEKCPDAPVFGVFANNNDMDRNSRQKSSLNPFVYKKDSNDIGEDEMVRKNCVYENDYAESPILDLSPSSDIFTNRSPLLKHPQRINHRAEHLRDWFYKLSPQFRMNSNPFFSSGEKPDIIYPHPRYLSSPVPTFRSRSDLSPSR